MRWYVELNNFVDRIFKRIGARIKVKIVSVSVVLGLLALIASGLIWLEVSLEGLPSVEENLAYSGFDVFGFLLPLILVYFAGLFLVSISSGSLRLFGSAVTFASAVALFLLWAQGLSSQSISGVLSTLEKASGVSGVALVEGADVSFLNSAVFSGFLFLFMAIVTLTLALAGKRLDVKKSNKRLKGSGLKNTESDPISLWDNQR
jgi:hypothetical protein